MAQMLAMVVNERRDDWDAHLPHVEFSYNNSVRAATGLAPNEVYMNRGPRLPLTVFEHPYARGHQGLARDQLEYVDLAADHQRRSFALVRNTTRSMWPASNAEILRCPTGSSNVQFTTSVAGCGSTTPPLPSGKAPKREQTPRSSKRSSRSTGRGHSRF